MGRAHLPAGAKSGCPLARKVATPVFDGAREEEITVCWSRLRPTDDGDQLVDGNGKAKLVRRPIR